jgi:hypothetical protein
VSLWRTLAALIRLPLPQSVRLCWLPAMAEQAHWASLASWSKFSLRGA